MKVKSIDIFCQVIDNFGDIGVCYRLYKELSDLFPHAKIRLILDKTEEFFVLCLDVSKIFYHTYSDILEQGQEVETAEVIIEAFACEIPENYLQKAYETSKLIVNLEYFSAEDWTEDFHLQESVLGRGTCRKFFFMPGISEKTGGILTKRYFPDLSLEEFGICKGDYELVGSIFSYEKDFTSLLESLQKIGKKVCLCILGEKSQESFRKSLGNFTRYDKIKIKFLPFYSQENYEALIQKCDFNFVRGEDSFARALLTGKPFLWHIYPQKNELHFQKLQSFLEKYCPDNLALQKSFYSYNKEETDYSYFWEHLADIKKHNKEFRDYIRKHCNLGIKLKQFIENF
ncbi:MAG TPA: elongation factor P maturation arginine rhamnosyltransferase EarP [Fusobacterium sp.]|uniref:elongation factor P maturation arginine rhamnosyltransferase EarP n=1 Tax=Fusobacterium sp. TaxID=68766 RepID=UPI002F40D1E0